MKCNWCLESGLEESDMNCPHQCKACFNNGFRTVCDCQKALSTYPLTSDIDFRGDQYFVRVYYEYPSQNTFINIKELKKQIITALDQCPKLQKELKRTEREHKRVLAEKFQVIDEAYKLKEIIQKRISELETGEEYGTCSNIIIKELKQVLKDMKV